MSPINIMKSRGYEIVHCVTQLNTFDSSDKTLSIVTLWYHPTEGFLVFCFHRKIVSPKIYKSLGIHFLTKMDRAYHNIPFVTAFVEIKHIGWQKTDFSKNMIGQPNQCGATL